jgi:hypothetical protein
MVTLVFHLFGAPVGAGLTLRGAREIFVRKGPMARIAHSSVEFIV